MADLIPKSDPADGTARSSNDAPRPSLADETAITFVELLFFAYRDFVRDPDDILEEFGFGRAHHRVLHFVNRHPGIRVAALLDVLNITKQSLARVLRQLIEQGYVEQQTGQSDRRERRLFLTAKGRTLIARLIAPQITRVTNALAEAGVDGQDAVERFLSAMIAESDRERVGQLIRDGVMISKSNSEAA